MDAQKLQGIVRQLEANLEQVHQQELAMDDELMRCREERLRQEGRLMMARSLLQMVQMQDAAAQQQGAHAGGATQEGEG